MLAKKFKSVLQKLNIKNFWNVDNKKLISEILEKTAVLISTLNNKLHAYDKISQQNIKKILTKYYLYVISCKINSRI